jgi:hypothetical protein
VGLRYPAEMNSKTGQIRYDDMDGQAVNSIKQTYMENWYRDKAIKEGMQIKKEVKANGEVELYITR